MKKRMLSFLCCLVALCGCRSIPSEILPAEPTPEWHLSVKIGATGGQPGRWHRLVVIYTSGQIPGYIVAHLPQAEPPTQSDTFKKKLSHPEMHQIYQLVRSTIEMHKVGEKPEAIVRDGASLSIRLDVFDRNIEVGYNNSGILQAEPKALLEGINAYLPKTHQIKWNSWADIRK